MSRKEELQKYLQEVANPVIEKLVGDLLRNRPKKSELPAFCKNWFQTYMEKTAE
jgi:hypothetical protein